MGFVKKAVKSITKPFKSIGKELGRAGDNALGALGMGAPEIEIDTSAQEAAARAQAEAIKRQEAAAKKAAAESQRAAQQAAQNARWQAEGSAQQFAAQQQREQLQQSALEDSAQDFVAEEADVQVGDTSPDIARRRRQFQAGSGTNSQSPSIRI